MVTVPPDHIVWTWKSQAVRVGVHRLGAGPTVLLLPALSSISTRREMRPLQDRLASNFTTAAVDWPGFGDEPRPAIRWRPDAYVAFLRYLLTEVVPRPFSTVAAGHAASYALAIGAAAADHAQDGDGVFRGTSFLLASPAFRENVCSDASKVHARQSIKKTNKPCPGTILFRNFWMTLFGRVLTAHQERFDPW